MEVVRAVALPLAVDRDAAVAHTRASGTLAIAGPDARIAREQALVPDERAAQLLDELMPEVLQRADVLLEPGPLGAQLLGHLLAAQLGVAHDHLGLALGRLLHLL